MADKRPLIMVGFTKPPEEMTDEELAILAKEMVDAMRKNLERLEQSRPKD